MAKLVIHQWNCNWVKNKLLELKNYLQINRVEVMILNDVKLNTNDTLNVRNYNTIIQPRPDNSGHGGVAILAKKGLPFTVLPRAQSSIEHVGIKLTDNLIIISAYNSPSNKFKN